MLDFARAQVSLAPTWLRGPARIDADYIVFDPGRAEEYRVEDPLTALDLAFQLATISRPSEIAPFVRQFGLLWHGPGASEYRERVADWLQEARGLRLALDSYVVLRRAVDGDGEATDTLRRMWPAYPDGTPIESDEARLGWVSRAVARWVSSKIRTGSHGLVAAADIGRKPGEFWFAHLSPDLLGTAYTALANMLVTRIPVRSCVECGRVFVVKDSRQRYCSDTCGNRVRTRAYAERKRVAQAAREGE